jgi:hypothetical protein
MVAESTSRVSAHTQWEGVQRIHRPPKCIRALFATGEVNSDIVRTGTGLIE